MEPHQIGKKLCGAKTRAGGRCAKSPVAGKNRCRLHGGLSTGPKTAAGKRRIAAAQIKHGRYVDWRRKRANEKNYFVEIKRVVTRAKAAGLYPEK